jgi:hypothetical protein
MRAPGSDGGPDPDPSAAARPLTRPGGVEQHQVTCLRGAAFGLELFGVDIITSGREPHVVDIASFPGSRARARRRPRLADHNFAIAEHGTRSSLPVPAGAVVPVAGGGQ